jgi:hypothetical protein
LAIRNSDIKATKLLLHEVKKPKEKRVGNPQLRMKSQGAGSYGSHTYGHRVRQLNQSRGGKEGNDAFLHDPKGWYGHARAQTYNRIQSATKYNLSNEMVDFLAVDMNEARHEFGGQGFYNVVQSGNLESAAHIANLINGYGGWGLNILRKCYVVH